MVSDADGSTYTMRAVYVEVRRPDRLVWIEADVEGGMRTTITFVDLLDGRTEVVTHQTNVPAAYLQRRGEGRLHHQPRPLRRLPGRPDRPDPERARIGSTRCQQSRQPTAPRSPTSAPAAVRALVLVDGAMCYRGAGPMRPLAALLQDTFTVYTYDRRGRGESSDTLPLRGRARGRGLAGAHRAGRWRGVRLRHLLRCGSRPGDRGSRPRDHQAGALRATVHGRGRRRRPDQGVHRTAPRAARRRAARATPWPCS